MVCSAVKALALTVPHKDHPKSNQDSLPGPIEFGAHRNVMYHYCNYMCVYRFVNAKKLRSEVIIRTTFIARMSAQATGKF